MLSAFWLLIVTVKERLSLRTCEHICFSSFLAFSTITTFLIDAKAKFRMNTLGYQMFSEKDI